MADYTDEIVVTAKKRTTVGNHHPIVTLKVGGNLHSGWKEVEIFRSIETLAGGFALTMSDVDPALQKIVQVSPGAACELLVDNETVITGYIDESGPEFDAETHEVKVTGRDKTCDLVDCAAFVPLVQPGIWAKGQKVLSIVAQIAQKSGITVKEEVDAGTVSLFALQPGETAFTAIDRIAKEAAVLPIADGMGGIVLTRGGLGSRFAALVEGKNILSAKGKVSWKDRFSDYYVFADPAGIYVTANTDAHMGHATDPAVTRWRPTFVTVDFRGPTPEKLQNYAGWPACTLPRRTGTRSLRRDGRTTPDSCGSRTAP